MGTLERRTRHLEAFYTARCMSAREALLLIDTLARAVATHCDPETRARIEQEWTEIFTRFFAGEELSGGQGAAARDGRGG